MPKLGLGLGLGRYYYNALDNLRFQYWNPPAQEATTFKPWTYSELIAEYDQIVSVSNGYMTKTRYEVDGVPVLTKNGGYELFSYTLAPQGYTRTMFIQAGIHGNEMDAKHQLLRLTKILVNEYANEGYEVFNEIRNNVKFIIVPCASPYGHETASMNVPYIYEGESQTYGINLNRNYDFNWRWFTASPGVSGRPPMSEPEVMHVEQLIKSEGIEKFNYAFDWHDGGDVNYHYWVSYNMDSDKSRVMVSDFINHLIAKYNITNPVIPNVRDTPSGGVTSMYLSKVLGIPASTVEWIGGLLGYNFDSSQMTQSLEIRANMVLMAYHNSLKGWTLNETVGQKYFKADFLKGFGEKGLNYDGSQAENKVTLSDLYARWDELATSNPTLITKSAQLGLDAYGVQPIHTYTFGNGVKKVLYVGGVKRYGATVKNDEFAIYRLIEYLCNDYLVNQSQLLNELKTNYTIVVLPSIDDTAGNLVPIRNAGLNNMALSYKKWQLLNGICQPTTFSLNNHDTPILLDLITNDLKCIVSGGEIMTGYAGNTQDYTTNYETHIAIPKNQDIATVSEYKTHLETTRNELVAVEKTIGTTFGDYAFDNHGVPTYFVQLKPSKRFTDLADYHSLNEIEYMHSNYEAGRRISNIVNLFLQDAL